MSRGRANTRGTVPLSLSKGKTLTYYTARTGAEVLKRVLLGNGPSAHQGAKTLVKKLA